MATLVRGDNFAEVWEALLHRIMNEGKEVSPRGQPTKELLNVTIDVSDALSNILVSETRDLNYRFMVAEWLWIQAGLDDVESISIYNSIIKNFSDDGISFAGAYGPRLKPQWKYILENLNEPDSRQAVASIWTPSPSASKDIPCTLTIQWFIREDCVNCTVNMRSSDAWLGLPYDFYNFSQMTNVVAASFELPVGSLTMNLGSSHLYDRDLIKAKYIESGELTSYSSPLFGKLLKPSSSEDLKDILLRPRDDHSEAGWPWADYAIVLGCENRERALEELYVLSDL